MAHIYYSFLEGYHLCFQSFRWSLLSKCSPPRKDFKCWAAWRMSWSTNTFQPKSFSFFHICIPRCLVCNVLCSSLTKRNTIKHFHWLCHLDLNTPLYILHHIQDHFILHLANMLSRGSHLFIELLQPSSHYWITNYIFSINHKDLAININWFNVLCIRKINYRSDFMSGGISN